MPFQAKQASLRLFSFLARALPSAPQAARKTLPSSPRHPSPSRTVAGRPLRLPSRAVLFRLSISFSAPSFSPHEPVVSPAFPRPVLCLPAVPLPRAIPPFLFPPRFSPHLHFFSRFARLFSTSAFLRPVQPALRQKTGNSLRRNGSNLRRLRPPDAQKRGDQKNI